jgi:thimet oligopeptidase
MIWEELMLTLFFRARFAVVLFLIASGAAQEPPKDQPPLWSAKPDVAAFEKMENDRLAVAQRVIDQIVAVKGARTIENTLAPYDEATRQLNAANYFSTLMQQVGSGLL